jgi:hypothetical protein
VSVRSRGAAVANLVAGRQPRLGVGSRAMPMPEGLLQTSFPGQLARLLARQRQCGGTNLVAGDQISPNDPSATCKHGV